MSIEHQRELVVDPEFRRRIPPLKAEEYARLEENLLREGCRDPVVVWEGSGIILDGHNRHDICLKHGIEFATIEIAMEDRAAALLWIDENQHGRRNLTEDQQAGLAERIRRQRSELVMRERARKGGETGGKNHPKVSLSDTLPDKLKEQPKTDTRAAVAKEFKVPERKLRTVAEVAKEKPDALEVIISGEKTVKQIKAEIKQEKREQAKAEAMASMPSGGDIHTGDLSLIDDLVEDDSVDLFFADPPYLEDTMAQFGRLADLAQRKLKPGGLCLVYSGQMFLPEALAEMSKSLDYYWIFALTHAGGYPQIWNRQVWNGWKPILVFTKRPTRKPAHEWVADFHKGGGEDKRYHEWGQDARELTYWIERLTPPGGLVVDPFCGGGTIPSACKATGRRWLATEIDPGRAAIARSRVLNDTLSPPVP